MLAFHWLDIAQDPTSPPGEPAISGCPEGVSQHPSSPMETAVAWKVTLVASLQLLNVYGSDGGMEGDGSLCIVLKCERLPYPRRG